MPVDIRARKLAQLAVRYSVSVKPGDNIIISGGAEAMSFIIELYKEVILQKAHPILKITPPEITDFFFKYANKEQLEKFPEYWMDTIEKSQAFIGINTTENTRQLTSTESQKITTREKVMKPIVDYVCNERKKIKRVTIAYPCPALAQEAEMSLTEYENFVYSACLQDWKKIGEFIDKILSKFKKAKSVYLIGENVDLKFQIHGDKAKADKGEENMPGGEIFMAPVRETLNGWIKFEYPSIRGGKEITDIFLKFENGKVIESSASKNQDFLRQMLATDENSSFVGEFGIGMNPKVTKVTNGLLFDEKIAGTIHLALGSAYKDNGGGNDSAIHWDIVKDMKKSRIILDGKIMQENGNWKIYDFFISG